MGEINDRFSSAFRDFEVPGLPSSGAHEPCKRDIRAIALSIEASIAAAALTGVDPSYAMGLVQPLADSAEASRQAAEAAEDRLEGALGAIPASVADQLDAAVADATASAEADRIAAQLAADTALAASSYYVSRSAGEAATTPDQLFTTSNGSGILIYYRRTSGGSTEIARAVTPASLAAGDGATQVGYDGGIGAPAILTVLGKLRSGEVSVMDGFGVTMDETTNDTTAAQLAVDALHDAGGGVLTIPRGLLLTNQIRLPATNGGGVSLRGQGSRATIVKKASTSTTPLIYCSGPAGTAPVEIHSEVRGLYLQQFNASKLADAIAFERVAKFNLIDVDCRNANRGVRLTGALVGNLHAVNAQGCNTGILTQRNGSGRPYPNAINLYGCVVTDNANYGLDSAGSGLHVFGSDFERNGTAGTLGSGHFVFRATSDDEIASAFVSLDGVWMEGGFGRGIYVEPGMTGQFSFGLFNSQIINQESGVCAVFASGMISANNIRLPSPGDTWQVLPTAASSHVTSYTISIVDDQLPRHLKHYEIARGSTPTLSSGGMASDLTIGSGKSLLLRTLGGTVQHEMGIDATTSRLRIQAQQDIGVQLSNGDWRNPVYLGDVALWCDADARLRSKVGMPTSATDGALVASQA